MHTPLLSATTIYVLEGGRGGVNCCPLSIKKTSVKYYYNIAIILITFEFTAARDYNFY